MPYLSGVALVVVYQHTGGAIVGGVCEGGERRGYEQLGLHSGGGHPGGGRDPVAPEFAVGAGK